MSPTSRKRCFADTVEKFISRFPDLKYDNCTVLCLVCNKRLLAWEAWQCKRHVQGALHVQRKNSSISYAIFLYDLLFMLIACNLPFHLVRNKPFQVFWKKFVPQLKLPSNTSLRRYLPDVKERLEGKIKNEVHDKRLWMTVALDETMDSKKNSILNILVRTVCPNKISHPYLLACKRIQECTAYNIRDVITYTLDRFGIGTEQVVMLVTDGAATMLQLGRFLKLINPHLIHVTCLLHAFHLVAEIVRENYKCVNQLVVSAKGVFHKSPKRIGELQKHYPHIPDPPQPIFSRWGTWPETFYYCSYFQEIKRVVMTFNSKESEAVKSQEEFENPQILDDIRTILANYKVLYEAMKTLEENELLLNDALCVVKAVSDKLQTLTDSTGIRTNEKLKTLLMENPDFSALETIYLKCNNNEPLTDIEEQLLCAKITSLDAERSLSIYKNIFSARRTSLKESTVEAYVMVQVYSWSHEEMLSYEIF